MALDYEIYDLGDFRFQRGATVRSCKLAYKVFGKLNVDKNNVIVYPTWYSGQHYDNEWLIGSGMALDPDKYFIIIPQHVRQRLSSSPSNKPEPYNGPRFPQVTACDNVRAQHRLVTQKFGVRNVKLVTGWSMGDLQRFHWGALYPDMVERILPFCGSAKCSRHNFVFFEGVKAALTADAGWNEGWYQEKPNKGLRAVGRVYAGWGFSQAFYREPRSGTAGLFLAGGFPGGVLGGLLPPQGCQQSSDDVVDLAARRHQRQRDLQGRFQEGARGDQTEGLCHARADRPLFPARGQPNRGRQHAERQVHARTVDLGPFRRRARHQSGRRQVSRCQAEGATCELTGRFVPSPEEAGSGCHAANLVASHVWLVAVVATTSSAPTRRLLQSCCRGDALTAERLFAGKVVCSKGGSACPSAPPPTD
jgi:hypothetical protein